jgi:hypothetical protein
MRHDLAHTHYSLASWRIPRRLSVVSHKQAVFKRPVWGRLAIVQ